jgi:hypothetical protein
MTDNDNGNTTTTTDDEKTLRLRQKFVALGVAVFKGRADEHKRGQLVCRAVSGNFAKRIANALNRYKPNEHGQ